jgi:hypothetical protein
MLIINQYKSLLCCAAIGTVLKTINGFCSLSAGGIAIDDQPVTDDSFVFSSDEPRFPLNLLILIP